MADEDDLFAGRPDGPRVAPAAGITGGEDAAADDDRDEPPAVLRGLVAAPPDPVRAGAGTRPLRIALLAATFLMALVVAPRLGVDDTYAVIYFATTLVWALSWAATTLLGFLLALVGVGRRGVREAAVSWVAAVPLALLWGLALIGALTE